MEITQPLLPFQFPNKQQNGNRDWVQGYRDVLKCSTIHEECTYVCMYSVHVYHQTCQSVGPTYVCKLAMNVTGSLTGDFCLHWMCPSGCPCMACVMTIPLLCTAVPATTLSSRAAHLLLPGCSFPWRAQQSCLAWVCS